MHARGGSEFDRVATDRAGRAGDEEGFAGPQVEGVQGLEGGESVERDGGGGDVVEGVGDRGDLRALERDGLIDRHVTPQVPVRVDYELTDLGRSLHPVLVTMKDWAESRMGEVLAARARYDAQR
ncbi:winged helix-turn-helix transcriptional regulator [Nocardia puris]|nr:winged helix-turn-helix transcriptional regulator [Nocardia puris]MBF6365231.1 winged helix-turn-helix transcriptional regulator [Nocardia puris]MBF6459633.1 winged helix-turn-helix transcriptional regulator [Nocardia puris]